MTVRESVPLAELTTLRIGGPVSAVIDVEREEDLPAAFAYARERELPVFVLGDGSNVLAADAGFDGVVVRLRTSGVTYIEDGDDVLVTAAAGESWDGLVRTVAERGLWGIENLAGIPGTAGAAPVQNIGAYGTELADTLVSVSAYDLQTGATVSLAAGACAFGYRESRFKREPHLVITSVTLRLSPTKGPQLAYADLARAKESGVSLATPAEVGDAVRAIRARKFPDIRIEGTAGSFFKNPIITDDAFRMLAVRYPDMPSYPAAGGVKVPLAYVLDRVLNLRGYRMGPVRLFEAQPLVLVADAGASAADVDRLASDVAKKVFDATNITIEREVRSLK